MSYVDVPEAHVPFTVEVYVTLPEPTWIGITPFMNAPVVCADGKVKLPVESVRALLASVQDHAKETLLEPVVQGVFKSAM